MQGHARAFAISSIILWIFLWIWLVEIFLSTISVDLFFFCIGGVTKNELTLIWVNNNSI